MDLVIEPDTVGNDLVEAQAQVGGPAAQRMQELRVQKRFAAGEADNAYSLGGSVLQEAQRDRNRQAVRPLNRHAAMGTCQVTLIRPGKRQVVGPKSASAISTACRALGHVAISCNIKRRAT